MKIDFVKFLRAAEHRTVQAAANVNPCADASDKAANSQPKT